jgi:hypothetical protein
MLKKCTLITAQVSGPFLYACAHSDYIKLVRYEVPHFSHASDDIQTVCHTEYVGTFTFMTHLDTKFHMPRHNESLVVSEMQILHRAMFFYIL